MTGEVDLPYFDLLLEGRRGKDPAALLFDSFVHWGYWENPEGAGGMAEDFRAAMERLNDEIVSSASPRDGQAILDAGCGFGGTLRRLDASLSGVKLTGVNIDRRQLEAAAPLLKARPGNSLSVVCADACSLPFADASFDTVLAVECIFHFPSRLAFLKEAARVLKPGGMLALSDFVPARPAARANAFGRWIEGQVAVGYGQLGGGWESGDYAQMARQAGLVVSRDRDVTRETLPTYPFLIKLIKSRGFGDPGAKMLWPTRLIYWLSALRMMRYRIVAFRKPL